MLLLIVASPACVNNYVVDSGGGSADSQGAATVADTAMLDPDSNTAADTVASTAADGDASGDTTLPDSGSTGTNTSGDTMGEAPNTRGDDSDGSATGDPLEACQPCESSAQCGDAFDLCVQVADPSVCLRNCLEPPEECSPGFECMERESVDGMMGAMCVPAGGACPGQGLVPF